MSKIAYLFPGQGSQYVGMGRDLYAEYPAARELMDRADRVLGFSLTSLMFGSDAASEDDNLALKETEVTQPALFTHSMAVLAALGSGLASPDMVAGHSLGEYTALTAAGALSFEDGLRLVRERGRLMAEAGALGAGTMAAIIGMDDADVEGVCAAIDGVVEPANFNSPGQVVISGERSAVERAMALASENGARKVIPLPVSGAFHSPLMEHARTGLASALDHIALTRPSCAVYLNVTAEPETDPEKIRSRLLEQLLSPVRWSQTLSAMASHGADSFVEVGAGRVLSGLVKRTIGRQARTSALGAVKDILTYLDKDA
jgi:[acyl-carrier-protein] S-malonyltransferase